MFEYVYLFIGAVSLVFNIILIIMFLRLNKSQQTSTSDDGLSNKSNSQSMQTEALSNGISADDTPIKNNAPETEILSNDENQH